MTVFVGIKVNSFYRLTERVFNEVRFPRYFSNFSKKMYGNFTHVFLLIYKEKLNVSYRRFVEICNENNIQRMLCIKRIPHFTTLQKFLQKVDKQAFRKMVRACMKLLNILKSDASIDATGFSLRNPSYYYLNRIDGKMPKASLKTTFVTDNEHKIILNVDTRAKNQHDNKDFIPLVKEVRDILYKIKADKAYDAEINLKYCRENKIEAMIPVREFKQTYQGYGLKAKIGGKCRREMFYGFDEKEYHKRSVIESINSAIKRTLGSYILAKDPKSQEKQAVLKVLAYNIEIIGRRIKIGLFIN